MPRQPRHARREPIHESTRRHRLGRRPAAGNRRGRGGRTQGRRGAGAHGGHRRVPHRCLHAVRPRPGGRVPGHPGPRGRRHRRGHRPRRHHAQARRSRDSAVHARVRPVQVLHLGQDQPVPGHPRHAGQGPDAGRHVALHRPRQDRLPLHGHLDLLRIHGAAGDRRGQDQPRRAARQGVPARLRHHHRHRRGAQHRQGAARLDGGGVRSRRDRS